MKGGLSVGRQTEILRSVRRRLPDETVSVKLKWSVKCRSPILECWCRATLILGMNVSVGWKKWPSVGCWKYPFMGPTFHLDLCDFCDRPGDDEFHFFESGSVPCIPVISEKSAKSTVAFQR